MNTRTALLNSAEQACRTSGYNGFSYADLAREVGIRKASIHHHFPTKADLALSVLERYNDRFFDQLGEISITQLKAADRLRAYVRTYRLALKDGETVCLCVAFSTGRDSLSEPVLNVLNTFHKKSIEWLSSVFEYSVLDGSVKGSGNPVDEAAACLALMEGAQLMARAAKKPGLFDHATRNFLSRLS